MRRCSSCKIEDRPILDVGEACGCGVEPDPTKHAANCTALIHSVRVHLVRIPRDELTTAGELSSVYRSQGWVLRRDGERYFKAKLMCQTCITEEYEAQQRHQEYKRACKAAMGMSDQSYAQMLSQAT